MCEVEPPRPSDKVAAAGDAVPARRLRGDLDTIVMTAIHKDPARRYASAAAVADDIERYLTGLPVEARAGSIWYRVRKAVARHRVAAVAASLLTLAVVGGFVSTAYQARRADRRFQQVRALANEFVFGVHDRIAALPGSTEARRALVQTALNYLENLREDAAATRRWRRNSPRRTSRSAACRATRWTRTSASPRPPPPASPALVSCWRRSKPPATSTPASTWPASRCTWPPSVDHAAIRPPPTAATRTPATLTAQLRAERPRDEATLDVIGDMNADIARVANDQRRIDDAVAAATRALDAAEALTALHPGDARRRNNLATAFSAAAAAHMAKGQLRRSGRQLRPGGRGPRDAVEGVAGQHRLPPRRGRGARQHGRRAGRALRRKPRRFRQRGPGFRTSHRDQPGDDREDPKDRRAIFDLVNALLRLGSVQTEMPDRRAAALATFEEADRLNTALLVGEPGSARYRYLQLVLDRRLGRLLRLMGRDADAERRLTRMRSDAETMFEGSQGTSARQQFAMAGVELAWLWAGRGDRRAAASAAAAGGEIAVSKMSPMLEAQTRADLGRAFLALARRAAPAGTHAASAIAEFDASAGAWRTSVTAPAMSAQRERCSPPWRPNATPPRR